MSSLEGGNEKVNVKSVEVLKARPETRQKLYLSYSRYHSYCMVGGVLLNFLLVLYAHIGTSAVVFGSICPENICPPVDIDDLQGACTGDSDLAIFSEGSEALTLLQAYMVEVGVPCFGQPANCIPDAIIERFGVSQECSLCFGEQGTCSTPCASQGCFRFPLENQCSVCLEETQGCNPQMRKCTGINFPDLRTGRFLQDDGLVIEGDCFKKESFDRFPLVNLTFGQSVGKAFSGGSYFLALLIVISSGIWPYVKNIVILATWFLTFSESRRSAFISVLATLGKWNLVDLFTIILIANGAFIQKLLPQSTTPLVIFAEARGGVIASASAAVWNLFQVEYIKYLDGKRREESYSGFKKKKPHRRQKKKLKYLRGFFGIFAALAFVFLGLGVFVDNVEYIILGKLRGTTGPNETSFNTLSFVEGLVDDCALYDGHKSVFGAYFIVVSFLATVVFLPLISLILMYFVSMTFSHKRINSPIVKLAFSLSNFCALDVFAVCLFTVALQLEGLIDAALSEGVNDRCLSEQEVADGVTCLSLKGETKTGANLLLFSVIMFWLAQGFGMHLIRKTRTYYGPILPVDL